MLVDVEVDITPCRRSSSAAPSTPRSGRRGERVRSATAYSAGALPAAAGDDQPVAGPVPKSGSGFDLAIAVAVLAAARMPAALVDGVVHLGELALDGTVRGIRGVLPLVLGARAAGFPTVVVPWRMSPRPGWSRDRGGRVRDLGAHHAVPRPRPGRCPVELADSAGGGGDAVLRAADLAEVVGQDDARHALAMAAAGVTTWPRSDHPAPGRRCSPNGCRACCHG